MRRRDRSLPPQCRPDADRARPTDLRRSAGQASPTPGRCRKAASTTARRRSRRPAANCGKRSAPAKALLLRESAKWLTYDVPEKARPAHWKGRWRGQAQTLVRAGLHRPRLRHRHRRPRPGVRRLAMDDGGRDARPHRALQAPDLRRGGRGIPRSGEIADARTRGPPARLMIMSGPEARGPRLSPLRRELARAAAQEPQAGAGQQPLRRPVESSPIAFSTMAMARCTWKRV